MNTENDHDYFNCNLVRESGNAYLVKLVRSEEEHWVPKSLCELGSGSPLRVLEVEHWFAEKEGMCSI